MSKIIPFHKSSREQHQSVREAAVAWIARLDAGADAQDHAALRAWLAKDPQHLRVLMEFARLWDRMALLEELSTIFPYDEYSVQPRPSRARAYWLPLSAAAVLVLAVGLWWLLGAGFADPDPASFKQRYDTVAGEQLKVDLEDGSSIVLNTRTRLEVEFDARVRRIHLRDGEGLFQVSRDEQRPFQVLVDNRIIEAVGTAFSVFRHSDGEVEVLVSEGTVLVYETSGLGPAGSVANGPGSAATLRVPLRAGQFMSLRGTGADYQTVEIPDEELQARLFWQHGMLLFQNDRLEDIVEEVARYTTLQFAVADELKDLRVGGYFRVDDVDGLLNDIRGNFAIDIARNPNGQVQLTPRQAGD